MSDFRKAKVFVQNTYCGTLSETDSGYEFEYDTEYLSQDNACAVSISLPLSNKPYTSPALFPFFEGLIPEGWLLNVVTHNWKIDANDKFGLLLLTCKDPIGDVKIEEA